MRVHQKKQQEMGEEKEAIEDSKKTVNGQARSKLAGIKVNWDFKRVICWPTSKDNKKSSKGMLEKDRLVEIDG